MEYNLEEMEKSIRLLKPTLKPGSMKFYLTSLRRAREINGSDNMDFIKDPKSVKKMLTEHIPLGSKEAMKYTSVRNTMIPISVYLESQNKDYKYNDIIEEYKTMINEYNQQYSEEQKDGKLKGRQVDNMITKEEFETLLKTLNEQIALYKKKKEIMKLGANELSRTRVWILFNILKDIPTRLDFAGMKLISQREYKSLKNRNLLTGNYLVGSRGSYRFSFNEYKTNKVYGENVVEIDKPLRLKLNLYLKLNDFKNEDVIFPMSRNAMSSLLNKTSYSIIKKRVSAQILRKFYVSEKYGGINQEQAKDAKMMSHTISTQQGIYNKTN